MELQATFYSRHCLAHIEDIYLKYGQLYFGTEVFGAIGFVWEQEQTHTLVLWIPLM